MKKIIVIGTNHYSTLGCVRMLGEEQIDFEMIIVEEEKRIIKWSKYIQNITFIRPDQLIDTLVKKNNNYDEKTLIFSCSDGITEFLDRHSELLNDFILPLCREKDRTRYYMDKMNMKTLAKENGFNVLEAVILDRRNEVEKQIKLIDYPCITKSINSNKGGKSDIFICNSANELIDALSRTTSAEILVEPLVDKKNELCIFGVAIKDQVYIPGVAMYLNSMKMGAYGGAFEIYDDKFLENYVSVKSLERFVKEIGYQGLFSIEFLLDKHDVPYFMEINLRVSGFDYGMKVAGANMAKMWSDQEIFRSHVKSTRCIVDSYDFKQQVIHGDMSYLEWFRHWKSCDVSFFWNKKDVLPVFGHFFDKFLRKGNGI